MFMYISPIFVITEDQRVFNNCFELLELLLHYHTLQNPVLRFTMGIDDFCVYQTSENLPHPGNIGGISTLPTPVKGANKSLKLFFFYEKCLLLLDSF